MIDLTRTIHEFSFEYILGTSLEGIFSYFEGFVTQNISKLNQNLNNSIVPKTGVLFNRYFYV